MLSRLLQPEIRSLLDARDFSTLKEVLSEWSPTDVAELISEFAESEQALIFRILPRDLAADIFEYIDFELQVSLLKGLGKEEVAAILNEMSPDDHTALIEHHPGSSTRQMITLLSAEERKIAVTLLGYPEESVGRLMTPDYIAVKPEWSINEVLNHIRQYGKDSETLNIIYVVDEKGKLVDDVRIRDIILASPGTKVSDLMDENFVALHVTDDQEKAVGVFKKYDRVALPVIDKMGLLIGIVTVDDVFDVAEAEATEDIHKIGGVEALDEPYSTIPILNMVKKRAVWLTILFLTMLRIGIVKKRLTRRLS